MKDNYAFFMEYTRKGGSLYTAYGKAGSDREAVREATKHMTDVGCIYVRAAMVGDSLKRESFWAVEIVYDPADEEFRRWYRKTVRRAPMAISRDVWLAVQS